MPDDPLWPRAGGWPAPRDDERYDAVIVGIPTHQTSLSPTHAHTTPDAVRDLLPRYSLSFVQDSISEALSIRDLSTMRIADAGNIDSPDTHPDDAITRLRALAAQAGVLIGIGGDNSATALIGEASLGADWARAGLITLDAHFDIRDGHSNGSPVRELLAAGLRGSAVAQLGIADFANSAAYAKRVRDAGITVIGRDALHGPGLDRAAENAVRVAGSGGGPIHLDIDVDVCDRSVAPATPASIPGGLAAWELRRLVRRIVVDPRVVSVDITEIDATRDSEDQRTLRLAAVLVLDIVAAVASRP